MLIAAPDAHLRATLRATLECPDCVFREAPDADATREALATWDPDVVLLDDALEPPGSALALCRDLGARGAADAARIVVLTGSGAADVEMRMLDAGADECLDRARADSAALRARVRAVLRRTELHALTHPLQCGPLVLDPITRSATLEQRALELTPSEFDVLLQLAWQDGRPVAREVLRGLPPEEEPQEAQGTHSRAVDMRVVSIRRKLGPHAGLLASVYGKGYALRLPAADFPDETTPRA